MLHYVACVLEATIPLMDHPSREFLASVEEDLIRLILKQGQSVSYCAVLSTDIILSLMSLSLSLLGCAELHKLSQCGSEPGHTQLHPHQGVLSEILR